MSQETSSNELERELDVLLHSERGARILAACDGDVFHARRILAELERAAEASELGDAVEAAVIRLPLRPFDQELERELAPIALSAWSWRSILVFVGVGLAAWAILAAIAFGVFELVGWLR